MRKLLFALGLLVVAALAAALAAPWLIDAGAYRQELARRVSAATGREVAIDGPVAFVLLPSPRVRASDVRVVAAEADAPATIDAKHVELELGWGSLLGRALEITHLRVIEPRVVIALPRQPATGGVPQLGPIAPVRIERTDIQNGRIVWADPAAKTPRTVEQLQATVLASPLASSIRLVGTAVASAVPVEFDAVIGDAPAGRPNPVSLTLGVRPGLARATLRGGYDAAARALRGKLQIEGGDLFAAAAAAGQVPPILAGVASQAFSASGDLSWTPAGIAANDLVIQLGETRATGAINATSGQSLSVDVALAMTWLDLDKLSRLERPAAAQRPAQQADSAAARVGMNQAQSAPLANPAVDLTLDLGIEAVGLNGGTLRQLRLNAVMSRGDLVVNQALALLPGETEFAGFAQIALAADVPRIDGSLSARSDNLRGLLEWLGFDTSGVPAGRLRRFDGQARIEGTPSRVELTGVSIGFDSTKATGAFAIAVGKRLGIGADIRVDQINVDAYALAADAAKAAKDAPPLLERFDANLTLAAQSVTWAGEPFNGVAVDALLQAGDVVLRRAAVDEVAGARIETQGKIAAIARRPSAELEIAVDAADASRLLRLADLVPFTPVPLSLRSRLRVAPARDMTFEGIDLTYGEMRLTGNGRVTGAGRLAVDLAATDLALDALPRIAGDDAGQLGLDAIVRAQTLSWGGFRIADARIEAHVEGGGPVALDASGRLFDGALDFTARSEAADRGKLGGTLTLRDADLAGGLAAVFGTGAISGRGDLRAAFSVPARLGAEIWPGLSGTIELTAHDGAIAGIDLPLMRDLLDPKSPPADIVGLLGAGLHGGATPFTALNATALVQQGSLAIEALRVATPVGEATGAGGADLARGTLDLSLTVPIAGGEVPPIQLQVRGPVDEARIALDFSKLQRYLTRRQTEAPGRENSNQ